MKVPIKNYKIMEENCNNNGTQKASLKYNNVSPMTKTNPNYRHRVSSTLLRDLNLSLSLSKTILDY